MDKYYIIRPFVTDYGATYGSEVWKVCNSLEEALLEKPDWGFQGFGAGTNSPRICTSEDINDRIYVYDLENKVWEKD